MEMSFRPMIWITLRGFERYCPIRLSTDDGKSIKRLEIALRVPILLIVAAAAATSDFSPVSPQSSNNSPLLRGIPSENHVHVDGDAKKADITLHHRKHYHGGRYSVKAKVTESADEADNKRGTSTTVQEAEWDEALMVMEVQAMSRRVEGQEMEVIEVWVGNPAPQRSARPNSNAAQNNTSSNRHNNAVVMF